MRRCVGVFVIGIVVLLLAAAWMVPLVVRRQRRRAAAGVPQPDGIRESTPPSNTE